MDWQLILTFVSPISAAVAGYTICYLRERFREEPNTPTPALRLDPDQPPASQIWQTQYETFGSYQRHMAESGIVIPDNPQDDITLRGVDFISLHEIHSEEGGKSVIVQLRQKP